MIEIIEDLYDIAKRLKEIDDSYIVFYNKTSKKYELHIRKYGKVVYQLTFPFKKLDARAITYCYRTRRERWEKLLKELEEENKRLEKEEQEKALKNAQTIFDRKLSKYL